MRDDIEASPEDTTEMMPDQNHDDYMVNNNNNMQDKQRSMAEKNMKVYLCIYMVCYLILWIILAANLSWTE